MSKFSIQTKLTIIDQDSIGMYLQEVRSDKSTIPLSKQEEYLIFAEYQNTKNVLLKERIIKANLRWVITVAKQYSYPKIKLEDLINEGNIGVIEAIDKFDNTRGISFITFATSYIRANITSYINNVATDIYQPANRHRINKLVKKTYFDLKLMGFEQPSDAQIVEHYMLIKNSIDPKLTQVLLNEIRNNSTGFVSMHSTISGTDDNVELCDTFKSNAEWSADYDMIQDETQTVLLSYLNKYLNEKELSVVLMAFGLNGQEVLTLDQISERMENSRNRSYTRERIGQILNKSIDKLKANKNVLGMLLGDSNETSHTVEKD